MNFIFIIFHLPSFPTYVRDYFFHELKIFLFFLLDPILFRKFVPDNIN